MLTPSITTLSVSYGITDQFRVLADYQATNWSSLKNVTIKRDGTVLRNNTPLGTVERAFTGSSPWTFTDWTGYGTDDTFPTRRAGHSTGRGFPPNGAGGAARRPVGSRKGAGDAGGRLAVWSRRCRPRDSGRRNKALGPGRHRPGRPQFARGYERRRAE